MTTISVVIPTHRRTESLAQLLASFADQTLAPSAISIFVVANLPEPETQKLVEAWNSPNRPAVQFLVVGALGVNRARNRGLEASLGDVVLMLDDDCILPDREYLERLLRRHEQFPEAVAVGGAYLNPPQLNSIGVHYNWICNQWLGATPGAVRPTVNLIGGCVSYRRKMLTERKLRFDESIVYGGAETEFHERLQLLGLKLIFAFDLSVIHVCHISSRQLFYKSYRQGMAKRLRQVPEGQLPRPPGLDEELPHLGLWSALLKDTRIDRAYRFAFALGEMRAGAGLPPRSIWAVWLRVGVQPVIDFPRRCLPHIVRRRIHEAYWSLYGICCSLYGRTRSHAISLYWTAYPILQFLRHNWRRPSGLLALRMPMTHPSLESRARPIWTTASGASIPVAGKVAAWPSFHIPLSNFVGSLERLKAVTHRVTLHVEVDSLPDPETLRPALEQAAQLPHVADFSYSLARVDSAFPFEAFRRFHRFSRAVDSLGLRWRAQYTFDLPDAYWANFSEALPVGRRKVSVIIPHHCDSENLVRTLKALSQQTLPKEEFEVLVIDNGINSLLVRDFASICAQFEGVLHLQWLVLESPSRDLFLAGQARNLGLTHAQGEIIQFLDSDILLPPEYLQELVERMQQSDVVMAKRWMLTMESSCRENFSFDIGFHDVYRENEYWEDFKRVDVWTDLPQFWKYACTYCLAVKRTSLIRSGPFDPRFSTYGFEDVDLAFRLFKNGARFTFSKRRVCHLFPSRETHNYHLDEEIRTLALRKSAELLFYLRPEKEIFVLCQGYFAPTLLQWCALMFVKPVTPREVGVMAHAE